MSDNNKLYRLVFTGNVLPGNSKKKVISRLQQMLHLDKEKASRLVAGKHKQINKKLTLDRAEKLRLLILKQGAECVLLPIEESFVSTQQLPMFIRNGDNSIKQHNNPHEGQSAGKTAVLQPLARQADPQESISRIRKRSIPLSKSTKLKYFFYTVFLMIVEAIVIWNVKPAPQICDCSKLQENISSVTDKVSTVVPQKDSVKQLSPAATKTMEKLRNISVRTSLWFADQSSEINPADVSWIWIQGDIGIRVRDMNDSWGNAIRYFGKEDRFELRSSGPDKIFYTDDDISRELLI
ncbi:hypothetical protein BMS3Bbin11_00521 [bacterium BMS3Bbin11]|nr:hypothetical protein BMS3Abin11_01405 [bacterium BMS3Abin11]GBE45433.1 hypothetical protein BMS3Bbin11_00521 [bacterium BMS3Bbin11]HDH08399.1 hypothetical protein [Gammaproteobacteria bacterium]HDH15466.1 hypothetical protein [Gammaproteobacteria bacterium]HDZ78949.1 hypothetical protein [Gammaproteobacteria bacterium]